MQARATILACFLAFGCKGDEKAPARSEPSQDEPKSSDDADTKPGRGLANTFKDALSGKRPTKALKLIPKGAKVVLGANVGELAKSTAWTLLEPKLGSRQRKQLEAASSCGVGSDKWRNLVVAVNPDEVAHIAMIVEAEGLGTRPVLDCLVPALGNFELSEDGKRLSDDTGGGIVLGDDAIAFAGPDWMPKLEQRIEDKGDAAGDLGELLLRTDQSKTIWFAGKPFDDVESMSAALNTDVTAFSGWVDVRDGMSLRLSVSVSDAKKVREELERNWEGAKGMMTSFAPSAVVDSVKFADEGNLVHMDVKASDADLETLISKLGAMF